MSSLQAPIGMPASCSEHRQLGGAGVELEGGEAVAADLVVDASGRSSQVGQWLEAAGWCKPREIMVDANVGYATRTYKIPEGG
jgi:hypothetical protein